MTGMRYRPLAGNWPRPEPTKGAIREYKRKLDKRASITRTCTQCDQPLSRYNPNTYCWMHDYQDIA